MSANELNDKIKRLDKDIIRLRRATYNLWATNWREKNKIKVYYHLFLTYAARWALEDLAYLKKMPKHKIIEAALRDFAEKNNYVWPDDAAAELKGDPLQYERLHFDYYYKPKFARTRQHRDTDPQ